MRNFKNGILVLFIFHLTSCQNPKKDNIAPTATIENKKSYTIQYDSSFTINDSKKNGSEFSLFSNKINPQPDFVANLNLMIQNLDGLNYDLDQFVDLSEKQIARNGKLIISDRIKVSDTEFHVLLFEANFNGMDLTQIPH